MENGMTNKPSKLAMEVMERYNRENGIQEEIKDSIDECVRGDYDTDFNYRRKEICDIEGISIRAVDKIINLAKGRVARRLYIMTELERLDKLCGYYKTPEEINEIAADNLYNLIKNKRFFINFIENLVP
jgi:hypothetical protein